MALYVFSLYFLNSKLINFTVIIIPIPIPKLYGIKSNCVHVQLGRILDQQIQRQKLPTAIYEAPEAKIGCREQKQGPVHAPDTQQHQRGGQTT